jgi:predicted TIM-barrel fold metal-dependent hydrolase
MDSSGSNSWMRYQPYDLDLKKIFERAIRAGGAKRILFGTDSTFFPRGFRYNILEEQFNALKALSSEPSPVVTQDNIELIFHGNIERLTGFRTEE